MSRVFYIIILLLSTAAFAQENVLQPTLNLKLSPASLVSSGRIKLGDLCLCDGAEAACDAVLTLELFDSPQPGREQVYSRASVQEALRKNLPNSVLPLGGADWIRVISASQSVGMKEIEFAIDQALDIRNRQENHLRVELKQIRHFEPLLIRPGVFEIVFPELQAGNSQWNLQKTSMLKGIVRFLERNQDEKSFSVSVEFNILKKRVATVREIAAGDLLLVNDLEERWVSENESAIDSVLKVEDVVGLTATRNLPRNQVLRKGSLAKRVDVKRGQTITLNVQNDAIHIASRVRALQDGVQGDVISVLFPSTKKVLRARVVDGEQVELETN